MEGTCFCLEAREGMSVVLNSYVQIDLFNISAEFLDNLTYKLFTKLKKFKYFIYKFIYVSVQ